MRPYKAGIGLWFAVPCVIDSGGQSTIPTSPVVERDNVEIVIEGGSRLFLDHAKYL